MIQKLCFERIITIILNNDDFYTLIYIVVIVDCFSRYYNCFKLMETSILSKQNTPTTLFKFRETHM